MYHNDYFLSFIFNMLNFFKKKQIINVGDVGIYQDVIILDSLNDGNKSIKYEFFVKVKAVGVYDDLVEINVISVSTSNTCNEDLINVVVDNIPKFIDPKLIKWEIKNNNQIEIKN